MIQVASVGDHGWIVELAAEVYRDLGDYRTILKSWLGFPGVAAHLWVDEGPQGFTLLHFYHPDGGRPLYVADLLAIAVRPDKQRQGIGGKLLAHALEVAARGGPAGVPSEIRLSVAEDNTIGRRLFETRGFAVLESEAGTYDGGQTAVRMVREL